MNKNETLPWCNQHKITNIVKMIEYNTNTEIVTCRRLKMRKIDEIGKNWEKTIKITASFRVRHWRIGKVEEK